MVWFCHINMCIFSHALQNLILSLWDSISLWIAQRCWKVTLSQLTHSTWRATVLWACFPSSFSLIKCVVLSRSASLHPRGSDSLQDNHWCSLSRLIDRSCKRVRLFESLLSLSYALNRRLHSCDLYLEADLDEWSSLPTEDTAEKGKNVWYLERPLCDLLGGISEAKVGQVFSLPRKAANCWACDRFWRNAPRTWCTSLPRLTSERSLSSSCRQQVNGKRWGRQILRNIYRANLQPSGPRILSRVS